MSPTLQDLTLRLPGTWCHLTLDPEVDAVEVAAQVDERIAQQSDLAPARQALIDLFLGWGDSARELGATMAAMRYDQDPEFGLAAATLLVLTSARDETQPVEADLADLRDRLAKPEPFDQFPPHLEEVDLPLGRALRLEAVREPVSETPDRVRLRSVLQYWIPLAARPYTLEFEATTSNLVAAPDIAAEVEAIVASVTEANDFGKG